MSESWTPEFEVREVDERCQLWLGGFVCGVGPTLQDAADDLVARLLVMVMCLRSTGLSVPSEVARTDVRWLGLLWELGEIAACGGDIRNRLFVGV